MTVLLFDDRQSEPTGHEVRGDALWIRRDALEEATGWHVEARGLCREDTCIPVPDGAAWTDDTHFDLSAFADHRGQGVARDEARDIWSFGPPSVRGSLGPEAPDFELPDFEGRMHRLSDYRGRKVLLMTWASW